MGALGNSPLKPSISPTPTHATADRDNSHNSSILRRKHSQRRRQTPRREIDPIGVLLLKDIPSDLTVEVEGMSFFLHKFPLVTRSPWMRRQVLKGEEGGGGGGGTVVVVDEIPGGAESFAEVARYCYGEAVELREENVAGIRCAAEFLEMKGSGGGGGCGLVERCDAFLANVQANGSMRSCVRVLGGCSSQYSSSSAGAGRLLLATADRLRLPSRFVDAIVQRAMAHEEHHYHEPGDYEWPVPHQSSTSSWWAAAENELCILSVLMFRRVAAALRARGLRYETLSALIVRYAQRSLEELMVRNEPRTPHIGGGATVNLTTDAADVDDEEEGWASTPELEESAAPELEEEWRQRTFLESIVAVLPPDPNSAPLPFLFSLLRASLLVDTTLACRLDLERRIAALLPRAAISDLLIPSFLTFPGDTIFDIDTVRRIVANFLQVNAAAGGDADGGVDHLRRRLDIRRSFSPSFPFSHDEDSDEDDRYSRDSSVSLLRVGRLVDGFLSEIAADGNLCPAKFVTMAKLLPDNARIVHDGLYRAIDMYLKAHPDISDDEKKKICAVLDCRKLSQEACTHAAQNERLPVHLLLQVLHCEQMKLRSAMHQSPPPTPASHSAASGGAGRRRRLSDRFREDDGSAMGDKELVTVLRENQMLRMEMAKMQEQLAVGREQQQQQQQQQNMNMNPAAARSIGGRPPLPPGSVATIRSSSGSNSSSRSSNAYAAAGGGPSAATKPPAAKFLLSVSRKLGKLNPFQRAKDGEAVAKQPESRRRRHSIS